MIVCTAVLALLGASPARGAASDPLFVFTPTPPPKPPALPPPTGSLYGPCGLGVDSSGTLYVSDYYHHAVDVFSGGASQQDLPSYVAQLASEDPTDGPCGLALDATNHLYVNNFHRNVVKFNPSPSFGTGTVFGLPTEDTVHHLPTGVAVDPVAERVYVDNHTYVAELDASGSPVLDGEGHPIKIGQGSLSDGYGVAVSRFAGTLGRLYVPDASTNTVEVYDPSVDKANPVAVIRDPFNKPFVSLRDSAIAVDRVTGDIYFADDTQPEDTEHPQAEIYVYGSNDLFKGHLKYDVIDARPPGLAVDNSPGTTQGRVYVTSGNSSPASVYAYGPGAATTGTPLPPLGFSIAGGGGAEEDAARGPRPRIPRASVSEITQSGNLRVNVTSRLTPKRLPRKGAAPISVSVGWNIATADGSPTPKLRTLSIAINRQGRFDTQGLPTCPYSKIQPASTQRALANCRSALVGRGSFSAQIGLRGQEEAQSYEAKGTLLVFKGKMRGKPVLFGQIYAAHPFATSFVIPFALGQRKSGTYGTVLSATLPAALRSWGNLTAIEMRLSRRYGYQGERHSFLSAGCPAPKGFGLASFKLARTAFAFVGGRKLATTVVGSCRVRG